MIGLHVPCGQVFAVAGIVISVVLLTQLESSQATLMILTTLIATANWWWARWYASARVITRDDGL